MKDDELEGKEEIENTNSETIISENNQTDPNSENGKKENAVLRNKAILVPNQNVTRRRAFSSEELDEGELIFTEKPLAWVARSICASEICHNCFKDIKTSKIYQCNICLNSFYCSKKCEGESKEIHSNECPLLIKDKLNKLSKLPIHNDILRLFIRVLSSR